MAWYYGTKIKGLTLAYAKVRPFKTMGLYARFKDPEGNVIGLWQDVKQV